MKKLDVLSFLAESENSVDNVFIINFESVLSTQADAFFKKALGVLKPGGVIEFCVLNFEKFIHEYKSRREVTHEMSDLLFRGPPGYVVMRHSVWDEGSLVMCMLFAGFLKVWTGDVDEIPPSMFYVKGIKGIEILSKGEE